MITNNPRTGPTDNSEIIVKILVLILSCFNLAGLFLLLNPQRFSGDTDVSAINSYN